MSEKPQVSKVEKIKESSQGLRGTLSEELANDAPNFNQDSLQLLKFHGGNMRMRKLIINQQAQMRTCKKQVAT